MTNQKAPKIAIVTGPTATGKTALGVALAQQLNGEVVSTDSMQIYRRMDIGTAKPSISEMQGIPHHMIDVAEPYENFSVARYVREADTCIQDILRRGKLPILVGGTGLYIDSLVAGREFAGPAVDEALRRELDLKYERLGGEEMLRQLSMFDPQRALKLHPSDKKRILRAIEVFISSGKTITEHDEETKKLPPKYNAATIVLSFKNREDLYARIDARVDLMVELGLFGEVEELLQSGIPLDCTAMQAIGYKEAAQAINQEISREEAIELIKRESRRYAKRQLTWFGRNKTACRILWNSAPDFDDARRISTEFIDASGLK